MDGIVVLDTGGSKCDVLLFDLEGRILGWGRDEMPGVGGRSSTSIGQAVLAAIDDRPCHFETLYVCTLGMLMPMRSFHRFEVNRIELMPTSEWEAAMAHANLKHGIVLLAGTGAFAHAVTMDGRERHLDGGGPILGDFGGGFHIGWLAVQAVFRADWHPRHATSLRERVLDTFGVRRPYDMIDLHLFSRDRSLVASVARIVGEEAGNGDPVAIRIVEKAADALGETFYDMVTQLGIENDAYTVVGTGSLIRHSSLYRERLWQRIGGIAPRYQTQYIDEPPVVSLAIHACRRIHGQRAEPVIARLREEVSQREPTQYAK